MNHTPNVFPVTIEFAGQIRCYAPNDQTAPDKAHVWKKTLLLAHGKAVVLCKCTGNKQARLSVRHHSHSDSFFLARFPDTGHHHITDCRFYSPDPTLSGLAGYQRGVIEDLEDGGVRIRLKIGLQQRPSKEEPTERKETHRSPASKTPGKPAMTLLGMLHLMWSLCGLNRWSPRMAGKRNLGLVHYQLGQAAQQIKAGRVRLSQVLLLATQPSTAQEKHNIARVDTALQTKRRLIAVAPLATYKSAYESHAIARAPVKAFERTTDATTQASSQEVLTHRLPIMGFSGFPMMMIQSALWARTLERFEHELIAWRQGERIICIMQTDTPSRTKNHTEARVTDIALMRVTKDWIPVESSYEATLADTLVTAERRFEKPLRFDAEDQVFPDFWLQDLHQALYPMEVWGMTTPAYETRKQAKIEHYDSTYGKGNWWSWNAVTAPLPDLPGPKR